MNWAQYTKLLVELWVLKISCESRSDEHDIFKTHSEINNFVYCAKTIHPILTLLCFQNLTWVSKLTLQLCEDCFTSEIPFVQINLLRVVLCRASVLQCSRCWRGRNDKREFYGRIVRTDGCCNENTVHELCTLAKWVLESRVVKYSATDYLKTCHLFIEMIQHTVLLVLLIVCKWIRWKILKT